MNGKSEFQTGLYPLVPVGRDCSAVVCRSRFLKRAGKFIAAACLGFALYFSNIPSVSAQFFEMSSCSNSFYSGALLSASSSGTVLLSGMRPLASSSGGLTSLQIGSGASLRRPVSSASLGTESQGSFIVGASLMFQAVDLADVVVGQDLWEYDYALSGTGLLSGQGLTIFFDYQNYKLLQNPPPPVAGWDLLSVQPDTLLTSAGFFDALSSNNVANLSGVNFSIKFVWMGTGTPGAQPFYFYDSTNIGTPIFSGQTSSVPEPSVVLLGLCGLAAWAGVVRARSKSI